MSFRQQKKANLGYVRAGGDVDEVFFMVGVEGIRPGEIQQRRINLLKVPRVGEFDNVVVDGRVRGGLLADRSVI